MSGMGTIDENITWLEISVNHLIKIGGYSKVVHALPAQDQALEYIPYHWLRKSVHAARGQGVVTHLGNYPIAPYVRTDSICEAAKRT
jgi:hypothetical protein